MKSIARELHHVIQNRAIEEFISKEFTKGNIRSEQFTDAKHQVVFHAHCYQKALSDVSTIQMTLSIPKNYTVTGIKSGCCGMAGAFGYEKEHYAISMQIGEQVLFPAIRNASDDTILVAPGTSCRHQIEDGTGKKAIHPVQLLFDALR